MKQKPRERAWILSLIVLVSAVCLTLQLTTRCARMAGQSMQPTIFAKSEERPADQVLGSSLPFLFRDPRRWDVVIFRYPLNPEIEYIGRIVGLPGESLRIAYGDLVVTTEDRSGPQVILQKPDEVRQALMREVFPGFRSRTLDEFFVVNAPKTGDSGLELSAESLEWPQTGVHVETRPIFNEYYDGYATEDVPPAGRNSRRRSEDTGDLEVSFLARFDDAGSMTLTIHAHGRLHEATLGLGRDGIALRVVEDSQETAQSLVEASLQPGASHRIEFANIDGVLSLVIDEELVAEVEINRLRKESKSRCRIELVVDDTGGRIEDVRVRRDIHYVDPGAQRRFEIPKEHYLILGDNSQASFDGRFWEAGTFEKLDGSTVIGGLLRSDGGNPDANPQQLSDGSWQLMDLQGVRHTITSPHPASSEARPFVPRDCIEAKVLTTYGSEFEWVR